MTSQTPIPMPPPGVIDLDTAITAFLGLFNEESKEFLRTASEEKAIAQWHMAGGMALRNSWCLWWHADAPAVKAGLWPPVKPTLIEWFNERGIVHGDDISSIILTSAARSLRGQPIDFEEQAEHYKLHWKKQGFEDGIFKY